MASHTYFLSKTITSLCSIPSFDDETIFATSSSIPLSGIQIWSWKRPEGYLDSEPELQANFKLNQPPTSLKFFPSRSSSSYLVSSNILGEIGVYSVDSSSEEIKIEEKMVKKLFRGVSTSVDVQSDSSYLVSVAEDGHCHLIDFLTGQSIRSYDKISENCLNTAKFISSDSFITASHSSEIQIFDYRSDSKVPVKILKEAPEAHDTDRKVFSVDFHPAKPWLIASGVSASHLSDIHHLQDRYSHRSQNKAQTIMFHDLRANNYPVLINSQLHHGSISQVKFHPIHPEILFSSSEDGSLVMWNTLDAFEKTEQKSNLSTFSNTHLGNQKKQQNVTRLRNDGLAINCFDIDTNKNVLISANEAESIAFTLL